MFQALAGQEYGVGIAVSVTNACPLTCKHCISNSSPAGERPTEEFLRNFNAFIERSDFRTSHITLTGGEPFYDLELLARLIETASKKHLRVGAITSGFWAKTQRAAAEVLEGLPGLSELTLSVDAHHKEFVPPRFIRNAFEAATAFRLKVKLRVCVQQPQTPADDNLLEFVRQFCKEDQIEIQQIITYGRASQHNEFYDQTFGEHQYCPAIGPHGYYNGDVIPCCNSIVPLRGDHPLRIGSLHDDMSLKEQILRNALFVHLKTWGASELLGLIYGRDVSGKNACDLCARVCTDSSAWKVVDQFVSSPERRAETLSFALQHFGISEAEPLLREVLQELMVVRQTNSVPNAPTG